MPQQTYGTYQYLLSVGAIVGAFTLTGMNSAVVRSVEAVNAAYAAARGEQAA